MWQLMTVAIMFYGLSKFRLRCIFFWRLFLNRLATTMNLFRRNILDYSDSFCSAAYRLVEYQDHLFFSCAFYGQRMEIGPKPNRHPQKIPAMGKVKPCFHGSGYGHFKCTTQPRNPHIHIYIT